MPYVRKTRDVFVIQGHTAEGWEDETTETTHKAARERLKEYRENVPGYPVRIQKRRERI